MNPGDTIRETCDDCSSEFDVTYEPKCKGNANAAVGIESKEGIAFCPFCGAELCDDGDEDEGDDE